MKVKFIISKSLKAAIKTVLFAALICGIDCGINAIFKVPITMDNLTMVIALSAIYLHFSEKEL